MSKVELQETLTLFPTIVQIYQLHLDNSNILNMVNKCRESSPGGVVSNQGGWQSAPDLYNNTGLKELYEAKGRCIASYISTNISLRAELLNSWANINSKTDYNISHVHPDSTLSCCYYNKVKAGDIVFQDPREVLNMLPIYGIMDFTQTGAFRYSPKEGDLVIFPSWLAHHVLPSNLNEDRVTISSNYGVIENE